MRLDPRAAAAGTRLIVRDVVGSTNAEALALARAGERGPIWVTAQRQTAGRGRRGRPWVSMPGNLYASLLLTDPAPAERRAEMSFVAALSVHDAVAQVAPVLTGRVAIKWPNDLLAGSDKFAGILAEGDGADTLVVGIGINCASHPADAEYPATSLAAQGADVGSEKLFEALSASMLDRMAQWARGAGFAAIRADWLPRASGIGRAIEVRLPGRTLTGEFEALDHAGRLVLRRSDGVREAIAAGDVFPLSTGAPA